MKGMQMTKKKETNARKGSMNPTAKLTEKQVLIIRKKYVDGGTSHRSLADEFGVGKATITRILSGKNWGWLLSQQEAPGHKSGSSIRTSDPEEWLANTQTYFCESLRAKITKATCRQNHEMAMGVGQGNKRSGLLGHPAYESAAKDRLYHCGSCDSPVFMIADVIPKKSKSVRKNGRAARN